MDTIYGWLALVSSVLLVILVITFFRLLFALVNTLNALTAWLKAHTNEKEDDE
jgi:hypothetical protein